MRLSLRVSRRRQTQAPGRRVVVRPRKASQVLSGRSSPRDALKPEDRQERTAHGAVAQFHDLTLDQLVECTQFFAPTDANGNVTGTFQPFGRATNASLSGRAQEIQQLVLTGGVAVTPGNYDVAVFCRGARRRLRLLRRSRRLAADAHEVPRPHQHIPRH